MLLIHSFTTTSAFPALEVVGLTQSFCVIDF